MHFVCECELQSWSCTYVLQVWVFWFIVVCKDLLRRCLVWCWFLMWCICMHDSHIQLERGHGLTAITPEKDKEGEREKG